MKKRIPLLFLSAMMVTPILSGCFATKPSSNTDKPGEDDSGQTTPQDHPGDGDTSGGDTSGGGSSTGGDTDPKKVTVAAHTLKDSNPPINVNSKGQQVSKNTWDEFRYGAASKFSGNYNFTYNAYSTTTTLEKYTKNGYYVKTNYGELLYERKVVQHSTLIHLRKMDI